MSKVKYVNVKMRQDLVEILAEDGMQAEYADNDLRRACRIALKPEPPDPGMVEYFRLGATGEAGMGEYEDWHCGHSEKLADWLEYVLANGWVVEDYE